MATGFVSALEVLPVFICYAVLTGSIITIEQGLSQ
jgi:hypothetical protein